MFLKRKILEILEGFERSILEFWLQLLSCQPCVFWPSNVPLKQTQDISPRLFKSRIFIINMEVTIVCNPSPGFS